MTKNDIVTTILNTYDNKLLAKVAQLLNGDTSHVQDAIPDTRTITIMETARRLNVARSTVYRLIERGAIKTVNLNGNSRVVVQSLVAYIRGE